MDANRFSNHTYLCLKDAGWFPGRDVIDFIDLPPEFKLFPIAANIIKEFGGLEVGQSGPGIERARSTIVFEPNLAAFENDRFDAYSKIINSELYPLGEADGGYFFLAIDTLGRVFLVMEILLFVDANFDKALEKLLSGIKPIPVNDNGEW